MKNKKNNNINIKHQVEYFKKDIYLAIVLTVLFIPLINISIGLLRIMEFLLFVGTISYQFFLKNLEKNFLSFTRRFQLVYFFVLLLFVITHIKNDFVEIWTLLMLLSILIPIFTYLLLLNISDEIARGEKIQLRYYIWYVLVIFSLYILHHLLSTFIAFLNIF